MVSAKDLKKNTDYFLHHGFYGYGGVKVRVVKKVPATTIWKGYRGQAVILKDSDGNLFLLHPSDSIYTSPETE